MLPGFLTQRFITGVVREWPVEQYIGNSILPLEPVDSMEVVYDVIKRDAKLSPFVAIDAESGLADKADYARVLQELACVREKEVLNEADLLALREPGTPDMVAGGMEATRRAVAERHLRTTMDRMAARVNGRVEWMRWQALQGSITYDDNKVVFTVSMGLESTHTSAPDTLWSDTTNADPIADINDDIELIANDAGRSAARMYVGKNIPGYLSQNAKIRDLLKYNGIIESAISNRSVLQYLGTILGLEIVRYDASYVDSSGTTQQFLDADTFVLIPEMRQPDGEVLGDVMTGPAKANNYQTGLYGWIKEEEDPWVTFVGAGIHAFPRIYHPNWIIARRVAA